MINVKQKLSMILAVLLMCTALAGCGNQQNNQNEVKNEQTVVQSSESETELNEKAEKEYFNEEYDPLDENYDPYGNNANQAEASSVTAVTIAAEENISEENVDTNAKDVKTEEKTEQKAETAAEKSAEKKSETKTEKTKTEIRRFQNCKTQHNKNGVFLPFYCNSIFCINCEKRKYKKVFQKYKKIIENRQHTHFYYFLTSSNFA